MPVKLPKKFSPDLWLDPEVYMPYAPESVGEKVTVLHCHPTKPKLEIKRDERGVVAHCHRCGARGASNGGTTSGPTLAEAPAAIREPSGVTLPHDVVSDPDRWDSEARDWVTRYLTYEQVRDSAICYSRSKGGLVFPLHSGGSLIGYQIRPFPDNPDGPKYLTIRAKGRYSIDPLHTANVSLLQPMLVLVEDYVSALKVAVHTTQDALPLCGTTLSDIQRRAIARAYREVTVALDNDNVQVKRAQAKIVRELSAYCAVRSVHLDCDVKAMSRDQIREALDPYEW